MTLIIYFDLIRKARYIVIEFLKIFHFHEIYSINWNSTVWI